MLVDFALDQHVNVLSPAEHKTNVFLTPVENGVGSIYCT